MSSSHLSRAWLEIRQHPNRIFAVSLAIMISVGFIAACLVFVSTQTRAIGASVSAQTAGSDVVVSDAPQRVVDEDPERTDDVLTKINNVDGVAWAEGTYETYAEFSSPAGAGLLTLSSLSQNEKLRWPTLLDGTWPDNARQIVVSRSLAKQYDLEIGHTLKIPADDGSQSSTTLTVTGFVSSTKSLFADVVETAFIPADFFTNGSSFTGQSTNGEAVNYLPNTYLIIAEQGTSASDLAARVSEKLGPDASVLTSEAYAEQQIEQLTNGADVFRNLLLVFSAIALLVGSIIIANTFAILVAQRRRQIGLLRAVGASTSQVRQGVLAEAVVVGVLGSLLGIGAGIGIGAIGSAFAGSLGAGLELPIGGLLVAFAVGVVVTVLAACIPAARASRVAPLEALRPVDDAVTAKRGSRLRLATALLLLLGGGGLVFAALNLGSGNLLVAIAGSFLIAAGILSAAPSFLPLVLRGVGKIAGLAGSTGRLAATNTTRNPGRAAATCVALMLGVGLIVTMQVGAASIKQSMSAGIDEEFPVDVMITKYEGALSDSMIAELRDVPGLKAVAPVRVAELPIDGGAGDLDQIAVQGAGPDAGPVVAAGFDQLTDSVVLAHPFTLDMIGAKSGDKITLGKGSRKQVLILQASDIAPSGTVVVSEKTLLQLEPDALVQAVWAAAADRGQASTIVADISKIIGTEPGIQLSGSLGQSAELNTILDSLLAIATALLAVAVAIALIGVGNTLGLSVIERTRESALLRALGLQRSQLRLMLAVEAILLALVGSVVGIAAGVAFGLIGTAAMVKELHRETLIFAMSVPQTLAVVGFAVIAGACASVLPGRRAANAAPTEALAEV